MVVIWKLAGDMVAAEGGSPRATNFFRASVRREPSLLPRLDDATDSWAAERPGSGDARSMSLHFVALDCETTGQSPHHLVELGAVAFTMHEHRMSFETLVHSNDRINPYARRIHGIDASALNGAPPVSLVVERFQRFATGRRARRAQRRRVRHPLDQPRDRHESRRRQRRHHTARGQALRPAATRSDSSASAASSAWCIANRITHLPTQRQPPRALWNWCGAGANASDGRRSAIC